LERELRRFKPEITASLNFLPQILDCAKDRSTAPKTRRLSPALAILPIADISGFWHLDFAVLRFLPMVPRFCTFRM